MTINLKAPELRELKPRIMVCGVGGAGGNAVNNMIVSGLVGVDFIVANTDAQALTSLEGRAHHPDGPAGHRGPRRRLAARGRPRRRRGGDRGDPRSPRRRPHVLRHRRHGRRHRHRRRARHRPHGPRHGHPHGRRRHQAVPVRGPAPHARRRGRHQRTAEGGRHADRASRTRTCSASPTRRPPSPTPSRWPTRCSIRASPASPT